MKYLLITLLLLVGCAHKPTFEVCAEQCMDIGKPWSEVVMQTDQTPACRCESSEEHMNRQMNEMMHGAGVSFQ